MCDFRKPPEYIKLNNKVLPCKWQRWVEHNDISSITEEGCYGIAATGSFYAYYTGEEWLSVDEGYERFIFSEEDECLGCSDFFNKVCKID